MLLTCAAGRNVLFTTDIDSEGRTNGDDAYVSTATTTSRKYVQKV